MANTSDSTTPGGSGLRLPSTPPSPTLSRRYLASRRGSWVEDAPDERTSLLQGVRSRPYTHGSARRPFIVQSQSFGGSINSRHHSRTGSWGQRLAHALTDRQDSSMVESKASLASDERVWYDQFTSTDWVHDSIADAHRVKALRSRKDFWGRVYVLFDGVQGWLLSALVGFLVAVMAYTIDVTEAVIFDYKYGYCTSAWYYTEKQCCPHGACTNWREWGEVMRSSGVVEKWAEYGAYICGAIILASASCLLTLTTKTVVSPSYRLSTLDENLAAEPVPMTEDDHSADGEATVVIGSSGGIDDAPAPVNKPARAPPTVYYTAAGSGVAEVRVILSGFVLHGFLGFQTLVVKSLGLVLSVASGLSLGKEGPYVHIATCVGNIACRLFSKYDQNDAKRREILSAAAASGVAVAFGAPLGGVLFCLEEVAYFFPAKTLFRTFFCCITAALTLKFLNPYGTHKIVIFQVDYDMDWEYFELVSFVAVGILGGVTGAVFIKASRLWAKLFRGIPLIKTHPLLEVVLVALVTGIVSYWNVLTKLSVTKLLYNLAAPCDVTDNNLDDLSICPSEKDDIPPILMKLFGAFLIKGILTIITFGIKVPAGIYVPSMVVGGLMGRLVGHVVQWVVLQTPTWAVWSSCAAAGGTGCIQPGVYGLVAAGATMCGVTRLSVTLAVILFEITGSLDYVLPFSLAILVAKWTADAIEPLSIYDLLTEMNSYPFLNNKHKPIFTSDLADIVPRVRRERIIDISSSPLVRATVLRQKLEIVHRAGEMDGGLPIVRHGILVGLIPAPDLEFALDNLRDEATSLCLMAHVPSIDDSDDGETVVDPTDFTPYIDRAPVALDIRSPMDLVYQCFAKLGLRYICVLRDGQYAGMAHKKTFVRYVRDLENHEGHM
ncbi:voltage-gated chloride channel protein [Grosmannia clavigera kw1407]|uniref:Voltage-gated chloride channel protein n=1 Tax=Grosmannia clavigera (strain kw1407 / UAMH 11150) TaxID=655863 RepID=F0XQ01_GROCL|nr:voltage-gated chloride channel protein [Grosmannia clavigera kw1407]EFX00498.1 voltage-gated chloride channel protein [Grosmannia clavigera kw1407]